MHEKQSLSHLNQSCVWWPNVQILRRIILVMVGVEHLKNYGIVMFVFDGY